MSAPFTPPTFQKTAFNCPYCQAYANFYWQICYIGGGGGWTEIKGLTYARCTHCQNYTVWKGTSMVVPDESSAPPPNPDIPENIITDYNEARSILSKSPRGSAALLRLCIQKLCAFLGESGKDINADIGSLVKKGLNPKIQQSLDIVRVVGNESVHPGQIDLRDNPAVANQLFQIVNLIAETMITQPKMVETLYSQLPQLKKEQIEKRDAEKK